MIFFHIVIVPAPSYVFFMLKHISVSMSITERIQQPPFQIIFIFCFIKDLIWAFIFNLHYSKSIFQIIHSPKKKVKVFFFEFFWKMFPYPFFMIRFWHSHTVFTFSILIATS